jgi:aspartate/methionine/tyrosine aminotransferase
MFSSRTPSNLTPNRLAQAVARRRAEGRDILDLTESNPTRAGLAYPADLLAPLGDSRGLVYAPHPFGAMSARSAVAADFGRRGLEVAADRVVLTTSTSESYAVLFKLLGDAGDEVLVPRPSYPLFDHLASLELVTARPYDLEYHATWTIDFDSVERAWTGRTRAVLIVSPNNPTGSFVKTHELDRLSHLCEERGAAIIADEVFAGYDLEWGATAKAARVLDVSRALTFSLGGLSKSVGLPQVKLGWIAVGGPDAIVDGALARLELICDTYLSVSTPVQLAAGELLARGVTLRGEIAARVAANYRHLQNEVRGVPACRVLYSEGGWSGVLQVPSLETEEALILRLLTSDGILVHPGYFFDFPRESFLVLSLLTPETPFREGVRRLLRRVACGIN